MDYNEESPFQVERMMLCKTAINGAPLHGQEEILNSFNMAKLQQIAKQRLVPYSKLKKAELIEKIIVTVNDADEIEAILTKFSCITVSYVLDACKEGMLELDDGVLEDVEGNIDTIGFTEELSMLGNMGIAFVYAENSADVVKVCESDDEIRDESFYEKLNKPIYLVIPDEVREIIKTLDGERLCSVSMFNDTMNEYACAASNLYGIISVDDFSELFARYYFEGEAEAAFDIKADMVIDALFMHAVNNDDYVIDDNMIISTYLTDKDDVPVAEAVADIKAKQEGKPRYIPETAEEFERYIDADYTEETRALTVFKRRILQMGVCRGYALDDGERVTADEQFEEMLSLLHECIIMDPNPAVWMGAFEEENVSMTDREYRQMLKFVTDIANNTRLWENNGFKPVEMENMPNNRFISDPRAAINAAYEQEEAADAVEEPDFTNVSRNQLCPCGSGKKYKNCCGKKAK